MNLLVLLLMRVTKGPSDFLWILFPINAVFFLWILSVFLSAYLMSRQQAR
jgi:hypothetical protein